MTRASIRSHALCLFTLLLLAGCGASNAPACTQRWCPEGLTVAFGEAPWPPGDYRLIVLAGDLRARCRAVLPLRGCDTPSAACDRPEVTLAAFGCALPAGQQGFHALHVTPTPSMVHVTLDGPGGRMEFGQAIRAQCSHPNGPRCDPRPCCSAQIDAPVVWGPSPGSAARPWEPASRF